MTGATQVAIAMDWGGTWTRAAVIDRGGGFLWQSRVANPNEAGQARMLESADGLLREAIAWCGERSIAGVGLAIAGPVDPDTGMLYAPPNLPALDGVSLKSRWEPMLGYPVWVGNDANLAAVGEFQYGAGREDANPGDAPRTLMYMTVSTGIGGGVVDREQVFLGANGLAVEVGHMTIDQRATAPQCQCGNRGCLESLASGTAIARIAQDRMAEPGAPASILAREGIESVTSESVFRAAAQGDRIAMDILDGVVQALSVGLTNVLHLYNPDLVVLGGGVTGGLSELGLLPKIKSLMLQRAMSKRHREFRLVASQLGDGVGMVGAGAMVWRETDRA